MSSWRSFVRILISASMIRLLAQRLSVALEATSAPAESPRLKVYE